MFGRQINRVISAILGRTKGFLLFNIMVLLLYFKYNFELLYFETGDVQNPFFKCNYAIQVSAELNLCICIFSFNYLYYQ